MTKNCVEVVLVGSFSSAIDKQNNDTKVAIKKVSGIFKSDVHAKRIFREIYILKNMLHDNVSFIVLIICDLDLLPHIMAMIGMAFLYSNSC